MFHCSYTLDALTDGSPLSQEQQKTLRAFLDFMSKASAPGALVTPGDGKHSTAHEAEFSDTAEAGLHQSHRAVQDFNNFVEYVVILALSPIPLMYKQRAEGFRLRSM